MPSHILKESSPLQMISIPTNLRPLKTWKQKQNEAHASDKLTVELPNGAPKPNGFKPLYHLDFGPYFFWLITGVGQSNNDLSVDKYYGPSWAAYGSEWVIRRLMELLKRDIDEIDFNQYSYLLKLLQEQANKLGSSYPHLLDVQDWLQKQAELADAQASIFLPARYNVQTLVNSTTRKQEHQRELTKPLTLHEQERLDYYAKVDEKIALLQENRTLLFELLVSKKREISTAEEEVLAQIEKQISLLSLNATDQLDKNFLRAQRDLEKNTTNFKNTLKARILEPLADEAEKLLGSFQPRLDEKTGKRSLCVDLNLIRLIKQYDTCLSYRSTLASRQEYAKEALALFEQNMPLIVRHFDPYDELDAYKKSALNDVLSLLSKAFANHVNQSLSAAVRPKTESLRIPKFRPISQSPNSTAVDDIPDSIIDESSRKTIEEEKNTVTEQKLTNEFFRNITNSDLRQLAIEIGFINSDGKLEGRGKVAMIWGMVETLVYHGFADPGQTGEVVVKIAKFYKIKVADNYTPDDLTDARRGARRKTNSWLNDSNKIDSTAYEELQKKQYESSLTHPKRIRKRV